MKKAVVKILLLTVLCLLLVIPPVMAATLGDRILKQGSRGDDVAQLQYRLNTLGFWCGKVDGIFGPKTKSAVMKFQSAKGIKVDGIVGPQTLSAMGVYKASRSSTGRFSARDIELLAKLVYAEARGEPYIGQVAVAATVLNRVKSPDYPNTIPGVIYQKVNGYYQYCTVQDGQIYLTPNETARRAVQDALAGWDPTGGAIGFYNPAKTNNAWVKSRQYMTTIGNHVFYK
ncbi:spore cortex-lytic enzyme [Thermosediminibacter oceani]|uniref:Spore cortex-lytic enzyme n=1 Tax=Thermosediminibacter oceani (strain ATCC BAA-1034 / DSM 16646 / JW/IW-1228P) TaxID=555079 RepID=D9RXR8_THEOJ|nr:spore cortex-lytic enzyme [Thermosediminibacter oceani]ADL08142.1 spore cortex-lytic enzyme [Thermosediminibacter oceani DSM 16646]